MKPEKLLIIRHGEKPGDPAVDAATDGTDLSTRGYERAGALAPYVPATFGAPDLLLATKASSKSNRPVETITPLSRQIGVDINDTFADKDYAQLAAALVNDDRYAVGLVLICWHHGTIADLVTALGGVPPVPHWPSDTFDRVWVLENATGTSASVSVQNLPQSLLFGDTAT